MNQEKIERIYKQYSVSIYKLARNLTKSNEQALEVTEKTFEEFFSGQEVPKNVYTALQSITYRLAEETAAVPQETAQDTDKGSTSPPEKKTPQKAAPNKSTKTASFTVTAEKSEKRDTAVPKAKMTAADVFAKGEQEEEFVIGGQKPMLSAKPVQSQDLLATSEISFVYIESAIDKKPEALNTPENGIASKDFIRKNYTDNKDDVIVYEEKESSNAGVSADDKQNAIPISLEGYGLMPTPAGSLQPDNTTNEDHLIEAPARIPFPNFSQYRTVQQTYIPSRPAAEEQKPEKISRIQPLQAGPVEPANTVVENRPAEPAANVLEDKPAEPVRMAPGLIQSLRPVSQDISRAEEEGRAEMQKPERPSEQASDALANPDEQTDEPAVNITGEENGEPECVRQLFDEQEEYDEDEYGEEKESHKLFFAILLVLNIALVLVIAWLLVGLLINLDVLPETLDFGYTWFNTTIYPIF